MLFYRADAVLLAVGITTVIVLSLTAFSFQTKWDFTGWVIYSNKKVNSTFSRNFSWCGTFKILNMLQLEWELDSLWWQSSSWSLDSWQYFWGAPSLFSIWCMHASVLCSSPCTWSMTHNSWSEANINAQSVRKNTFLPLSISIWILSTSSFTFYRSLEIPVIKLTVFYHMHVAITCPVHISRSKINVYISHVFLSFNIYHP